MGTDIHIVAQILEKDRWISVGTPCDDRNYTIFAVLAGVRNRHGLAEPLKPISPPKGLPEDLEEGEYVDGVWLGDHSHSYLSYKEILSYDWDKPMAGGHEASTVRDCFVRMSNDLEKLFAGHAPENCRIVFGFDC